jgi:23S rRNA (adenine-N6)-dimethyltransferase
MEHVTHFSQNFLRDPRLVKALLSKTNISADDTVYDIGSGKGVISAALAQQCHTVISVELDAQLVRKLRQNLQAYRNILVYEADFLSMALPQTPYKVFANIPFNLSADILRKLTDTPYPPTTSYLIVQKEFADKLISDTTSRYNSQLSILLGVRFAIRIVQRLHAVDFYPRPNVTTVLLEVAQRPDTLVAADNLALFRDFIAYTYNAFQPSVARALAPLFTGRAFGHIAESLQCPVDATPAQLNLAQWLQLFAFATEKRPGLTKIVSGQESIMAQRHSKRTKRHRTS